MSFLTQSVLLTALGWSLFNSLWQMGLLWLCYPLLLFLFRDMSPRKRHGLALILLLLGTAWTVITFISACLFPLSNAGAPSFPLLSLPPSFISELLSYGSSLYLLIAGSLLIRSVIQYWRCKKFSRQGLSRMPASFRVFAESTARQMGISRPVNIWTSSLAEVPMTLGFLRPLILVPLVMISQLTPGQVEAILVHELAHIRRKDYLLNWVVILLEGVFFFNPFARLLIGELRKEREHCCDDLVIQFKYDPHSYVSALLSLATVGSKNRQPAIAATGGGDKLLLGRAQRLLEPKRRTREQDTRSWAFFGLIGVLMLLSPSGPPSSGPTPPGRPITASLAGKSITDPVAAIPLNAAKVVAALPHSGYRKFSPEFIVLLQEIRQTVVLPTKPAIPRISHSFKKDRDRIAKKEEDEKSKEYNEKSIAPIAISIAAPPHEFVTVNVNQVDETETKDYSIGQGTTSEPAPVDIATSKGAPFVPNSSFSYQFLNDTSRLAEKTLYLQLATELEIRTAVEQLQKDWQTQLRNLQSQLMSVSEKDRHPLLDQQLKLQRVYQQKLNELLKKRETAGARRKIIYI